MYVYYNIQFGYTNAKVRDDLGLYVYKKIKKIF